MLTEKSLLFKLLSEENIQVIFANVRTASFDTKQRLLTIPHFNFLSCTSSLDDELKSAILDCFGGHEVGHALHTPAVTAQEYDSWQIPFDYVNVVEDCRVERFVKNRYPGLKPIMYSAYRTLFNLGFFGKVDPSNLNLIDRINLYFKVGLAANVKFSDSEKSLVKACSEVMTFDEVVSLAKKIYEFSKKNTPNNKANNKSDKSDKSNKTEESANAGLGDKFDSEESEYDESEQSEDSDTEDSEDSDTEDSDTEDSENSNSNSEEDDSEEDDNAKEVDQTKNDTTPNVEHSVTQESFTHALVDEADKSNKIFQWKYTIDRNLFKKIIIEPNDILNNPHIEKAFNRECEAKDINTHYNNWINNNNKVVNYLVKEFEMKRAAHALNRAVQHSTGLINNKKLYAYKLTDEIFKRATNLPNGKDHSLTILIDWSGSMDNYSNGALRQAITFANFCRRAQIPFNVFLFTGLDKYDNNKELVTEIKESLSDDQISIGDISLIRVLTNKMTNSEFTKMSKILFANISVGPLMRGFTPLNSALLIIKDILKDVIIANKTEKNTLIILSDGANTEALTTANPVYKYGTKAYIINPNNNLSYEFSYTHTSFFTTENIMKMVKDELKVNIMWIFLSNSLNNSESIRFRAKRASRIEMKEFNSEGFINHNIRGDGVDVCQIINNKRLSKISEIERSLVAKSTTKGALQNAFSKMMNTNILNKTLLNQWIKTINI